MARNQFSIDNRAVQAIWDAHGLGRVESIDWASKGRNNPTLMINGAFVLRFDGIINEGVSRFRGEQRIYDRLNSARIPAPTVITVDDSKTLAPNDYIIMTKIDGTPLIDAWRTLTPDERERAAYRAGELLAHLHTLTFDTFGKLYGEERVFGDWYRYVDDYFRRYGTEAVAEGCLSPQVRDRMAAVIEAYRALLSSVTPARLIHWDYHFENLLYHRGEITGVLDFEWALSGDAAHDFNRRDQWESDCPGSRAPLYRGYTNVRPLDPDHEQRVSLYQMIWYMDCVVDASDEGEADQFRQRLLAELARLER